MKTSRMRDAVFAALMMACTVPVALMATAAFAGCTLPQDDASSVFDVPKFQSTYPVKLMFDNVGNLKPRAAVKMAGVPVAGSNRSASTSAAMRRAWSSISAASTIFRKIARRPS